MSVVNNAVMFGMAGEEAIVEVVGVGASQAAGTRLNNVLSRVTKSVGSGAFVLPSIGTGEANEIMWFVNDTGAAVNIFPAVGEKIGGATNANLAVAGGATAVCVPVLNSAGNYPTTLDWRCQVLT